MKNLYDMENCLAFITSCAAKKISDTFNEKLILLGITRIQWNALYYLGDYDYMTQTELAKKLNVKNSTATRLVGRMERDGHINRVKSDSDRRTVKLMITPNGRLIRERIFPEEEKLSILACSDISEEDKIIFKKVLNKILTNIEEN